MIKYYNYALVYHNYIPGCFIRAKKMGILEIQIIDGQVKQAVHPSCLGVLIAR